MLTNPLNTLATTDQVHISHDGTLYNAALSSLITLVQANQPSRSVEIDSHYGVITADADGATVTFDLAVSDKHKVTLAGNRTLALANPTVGQQFVLILIQDGTGSRTVTWFSGIKWAGGSAPTLTTTAAKADVVTLLCYGTNLYYGFVAGQNL